MRRRNGGLSFNVDAKDTQTEALAVALKKAEERLSQCETELAKKQREPKKREVHRVDPEIKAKDEMVASIYALHTGGPEAFTAYPGRGGGRGGGTDRGGGGRGRSQFPARKTVKGMLDLKRIAAKGLLPGGLKLSDLPPLHVRNGLGCLLCQKLRVTEKMQPYTVEYKDATEYERLNFGHSPWRPSERPIQRHEVFPHSLGFCSSAWIHYDELSKTSPDLEWVATPLPPEEALRRLAESERQAPNAELAQ